MRRRALSLLLALPMGAVALPARAADGVSPETAQLRERLNKLLYWSLSDELKLSPQQEKQMIAAVEAVQAKREAAFRDRDEALALLRKLGKEAAAKGVEAPLQRYQKALEELTRLEAEEYHQLLPLLGANTLARFYVVRDDLAQKVRDALKSEKK